MLMNAKTQASITARARTYVITYQEVTHVAAARGFMETAQKMDEVVYLIKILR